MKQDAKFKKKLKAFGLKVREVREKKGWTLEDTEDHGWSNWQHLQKIESGKNITLTTAFKICEVFNIKLSELLRDF